MLREPTIVICHRWSPRLQRGGGGSGGVYVCVGVHAIVVDIYLYLISPVAICVCSAFQSCDYHILGWFGTLYFFNVRIHPLRAIVSSDFIYPVAGKTFQSGWTCQTNAVA